MKLVHKYFYYLFTLLFLPANHFLLIKSANSQVEENNSVSLSTDYLKKIPDYDYIIGTGDTLSIIVSRDYPELNSVVTIDGEGTIYVPKLGRIFVRDLSTNELNDLLNNAYKKYVKYPAVELVIKNYRPVKVLVKGEVDKPGLVDLQGSMSVRGLEQTYNVNRIDNIVGLNFEMEIERSQQQSRPSSEINLKYYFPTVIDAIRESGGITPYSDLTKVELVRRTSLSSGKKVTYRTLNFEQVLYGDSSQNVRIYDSDIINIPKSDKKNNLIFRKATLARINPKFSKVFIFGKVKFPGGVAVSREAVLNDAIAMADANYLKGPIKFVRYNNDGSIERRKFKFKPNAKRGAYNNPTLRDGDFILVGKGPFTASAEVIRELTSPFVGIASVYGLMKVFND